MKIGRSLVDLAMELKRQLATKRDLVLPTSLLQCRTGEGGDLRLIVDANSHTGFSGAEYGVTNLARRQLADKLKIPFAYSSACARANPTCLTITSTPGCRPMETAG